jgi:hypothetical protein
MVVGRRAETGRARMADSTRKVVPAELPDAITTYLDGHRAHDVDLAVSSFTADGSVTDDGRTHAGRDAIRAWLSRSAGEFTYTVEPTGAERIDDDQYDVTQHLEGNFPGGQVDLHFRFTMRDGSILRLVIEK